MVKQVNDFEKELIEKNRDYLTRIFSDFMNIGLTLQMRYDFVEQKEKAPKAIKKVDKKELIEKIRRDGGDVIKQLIDEIDLELI